MGSYESPQRQFGARRGELEIDPNFRPPWRPPGGPRGASGRVESQHFHWNPHHFHWNLSANLLRFPSLQGGGLALEFFENFKLAPRSKPWCPRGVGSVWLSSRSRVMAALRQTSPASGHHGPWRPVPTNRLVGKRH